RAAGSCCSSVGSRIALARMAGPQTSFRNFGTLKHSAASHPEGIEWAPRPGIGPPRDRIARFVETRCGPSRNKSLAALGARGRESHRSSDRCVLFLVDEFSTAFGFALRTSYSFEP